MTAKHRPALSCSPRTKRIRRPERTVPGKRCQPRPRTGQPRPPCKISGNAIIEVVASLLALMPFVIGIPILGKHFDVRHKTFDAARYAVWERTVWHGDTANRKEDRDVELEMRDRILGDPAAGLISATSVRALGTSENGLWRDSASKSLVDYHDGLAPIALQQQRMSAPVDVGRLLGPALAHGQGWSTAATALGIDDLRFSRETFARATVSLGLRDIVARGASSATQPRDDTPPRPLTQRANAAILSDTWSAHDEHSLGRSVDRLTANELIESLERPGQFIAMQAPAKGKALYGEGQFAAGIDLRPSSAVLPAAYVNRK